jgi:hypothetical protein
MGPEFKKFHEAAACVAFVFGVLTAAAHAAESEYQVDRLAKLIVAREHGKLLSLDEVDHNSAELSLPLAPVVTVGEIDGDISVEFDFDALPPPGGPAESLMARVAALGSWRPHAEAEALLRRCLTQWAALWRKDGFYSFEVPKTVTRVHTPTFSCASFAREGKRTLQIHFQRPSKE